MANKSLHGHGASCEFTQAIYFDKISNDARFHFIQRDYNLLFRLHVHDPDAVDSPLSMETRLVG